VRLHNTEVSKKLPLNKTRNENILLPVGYDEKDNIVCINILKDSHILIGGENDSERFLFIRNLVKNLEKQKSPDGLHFILIDPSKKCFFSFRENNYYCFPILTDTSSAMVALRWCYNEMERRFLILNKEKKINIREYNNKIVKGRLPIIFIFVSEIDELMKEDSKEVEKIIISFFQMAKGVGIHLVISAKNLNRKTVTGMMIANSMTKAVFKTASKRDSKWLLYEAGAEKLSGKGNFILQSLQFKKNKYLHSLNK